MNTVVCYQDEEGRPTVIPELPLQVEDGVGRNSLDEFEIRQWRMVNAKNAINFENVESTP